MQQRLDGSTWIGLGLGVTVLVSCLLLGHMPLHMVLQPEALIIVLGGTLTAVMIQFAGQALPLLTSGLQRCLFSTTTEVATIVDYITDMANYIRAEGMLAVQPMLEDIPWPMLRNGVQLMIDNRPDDLIHSTLSTEMEIGYRKAMDQSRLFEAAGGFAPTMGIIGAVVGLVQVVGAFESPQQLTQGIASAFIATLYGVALANLFLLPLAGRLRQKARDTWFEKTVILEGVMSLYAGDHPMVTEEKLTNFLHATGKDAGVNRRSAVAPMAGQSRRSNGGDTRLTSMRAAHSGHGNHNAYAEDDVVLTGELTDDTFESSMDALYPTAISQAPPGSNASGLSMADRAASSARKVQGMGRRRR